MFKKVLIANRGEIAVRVIRTCKEMGIYTIAMYESADLGALHMRQADESVLLPRSNSFLDIDTIIEIARRKGVQAIHPGYGFLAERADFTRLCQARELEVIGPAAETLDRLSCKLDGLELARSLGINTLNFYPQGFELNPDQPAPGEEVAAWAERLGYPLFIKSCSGRPWRVERLVHNPDELGTELERLRTEARSVYTDPHFYLEQALLPACQVTVPVAADQNGSICILGDYQNVVIENTHRSISEAPAVCLNKDQREEAWLIALKLAASLGFRGIGAAEFMVNGDGKLYFVEFKPYLPFEHPLTEVIRGVDLVREQINIAAGNSLSIHQSDIHFRSWAMMGCLRSNLPDSRFIDSGEIIQACRLPGGPHIRLDAHLYPGMRISSQYDTLLAKLIVQGEDRQTCLVRMQRALQETRLQGVSSNLGLLQSILASPAFYSGVYNTDCINCPDLRLADQEHPLRDLAVAAALLYLQRMQTLRPAVSEQFLNGWRRNQRIQPQWLYSGLTYEQIGRQN